MPIIYYNENEQKEQAIGGILLNNQVKIYIVDRAKPNELIFLGGHRIDDALDLNVTEPLIFMEYENVNGINTVVERQVTSEIVKSVTFNLQLPSKSISVVKRLAQRQDRCTYDMLLIPQNCDTNCDLWAWYGADVKFNKERATNGAVGFDDNQAQITVERPVRVSGEILNYLGIQPFSLFTTDGATNTSGIFAVDLVVEEPDCDCGCDYDVYYLSALSLLGGAQEFAYRLAEQKETTYIDITTLGTSIGQSNQIEKIGNNVVLAGRDGSQADLIVGYWTVGSAAFSTPILDDVATEDFLTGGVLAADGFVQLLKLNNRLYIAANGSAGDDAMLFATSNGIDWKTVTDSLVDVPYSSYADSANNYLIFGGALANLWTYNPRSNKETEVTNNGVAFPVASNVTAITMQSPTHIIVGFSTGELYEAYDWNSEKATGTFELTNTFANAVNRLSSDQNNGYRLLVITGNELWERSPNSYLEFKRLFTASELSMTNLLNIVKVDNLPEEKDNVYFVSGGYPSTTSNDPVIYRVSSCGFCVN